ncbi:lasso peptide biosynthesis protein [Pendulispora albinea]|uniref:Lasso peptide biosynthesis protein n=1 Tax=Pendulispora albinea TaxID=2741071 RepID=A0ABZ2LZV0_9BACT
MRTPSTTASASSLVANHLLHAFAWCALRVHPPVRAKALVDKVARWMRPIDDRDEAARLLAVVDGHGTCLSRALTVAARTPRAEVVIAVRGLAPRLSAHAWVELDGRSLREEDVAGQEIGRLASSR